MVAVGGDRLSDSYGLYRFSRLSMDMWPALLWQDVINKLPGHLRAAYEAGGKELLIKAIKMDVAN